MQNFYPLLTRLHRLVRNKIKKKHLWLHHICLYQKINTVCCRIQYVQNIQKISSSTQCTKWTWLIPQLGDTHNYLVVVFFQSQEIPAWRSRVAVVVGPSRHPRLRLGDVGLNFALFALGRFLFDPHGEVARDAVVLARALEKSALGGKTQRLGLRLFFFFFFFLEDAAREDVGGVFSSLRNVLFFCFAKRHKRQKRRQTERLEAAVQTSKH